MPAQAIHPQPEAHFFEEQRMSTSAALHPEPLMTERIDTVVIGGGQAGLTMRYLLSQEGREHVVLEEHRIGHAWRTR